MLDGIEKTVEIAPVYENESAQVFCFIGVRRNSQGKILCFARCDSAPDLAGVRLEKREGGNQK